MDFNKEVRKILASPIADVKVLGLLLDNDIKNTILDKLYSILKMNCPDSIKLELIKNCLGW